MYRVRVAQEDGAPTHQFYQKGFIHSYTNQIVTTSSILLRHQLNVKDNFTNKYLVSQIGRRRESRRDVRGTDIGSRSERVVAASSQTNRMRAQSPRARFVGGPSVRHRGRGLYVMRQSHEFIVFSKSKLLALH